MDKWFLCIDCERCYKQNESRVIQVKPPNSELLYTVELCPYADCGGNSEVTYRTHREERIINGWSGGWSWDKALEAIPDYPEIPERGKVYRIYPKCPPDPIYPFRNRPNRKIKVTFDWNGLINLQNGTGDIEGLSSLMELHSKGAISICIPAIAASENQKDGRKLEHYQDFEEFVSKLGLKDYEEIQPMFVHDVCYLGHGLACTPPMMRLAR